MEKISIMFVFVVLLGGCSDRGGLLPLDPVGVEEPHGAMVVARDDKIVEKGIYPKPFGDVKPLRYGGKRWVEVRPEAIWARVYLPFPLTHKMSCEERLDVKYLAYRPNKRLIEMVQQELDKGFGQKPSGSQAGKLAAVVLPPVKEEISAQKLEESLQRVEIPWSLDHIRETLINSARILHA